MFKSRGKLFWIVLALALALVVFLFPALIAYRYTADSQRMRFVDGPWRGWSFLAAALAVPADSQLKTSGQALRKADWLFHGTVVDPREVQLLFVPKHKAFFFRHPVGKTTVTSRVVPAYRFIWEIRGRIDTVNTTSNVIVGVLDYKTGRLLYDVRIDLPPGLTVPLPSDTGSPSPSPSQP